MPGEDFTSCYNRSYAPKGMEDYGVGGSGIVPTSWALLALMTAKCSDTAAVERGIKFLLSQQLDNGDFPQQGELDLVPCRGGNCRPRRLTSS